MWWRKNSLVLAVTLGAVCLTGCLDFNSLVLLYHGDAGADFSLFDGSGASDMVVSNFDASLPNDATVTEDQMQAECVSGGKDCMVPNTPRLCVDGKWQAQSACAAPTAICANGVCVPQCNNGDKDCADTTPRVCGGGEWLPQSTCTNPTPLCEKGACVECRMNEVGCVNDSPRICASGKWSTLPACAGVTPKCTGGTCVACLNGAKDCSGNNPRLCVANVWELQSACPEEAPVCNSGVCCTPMCNGKACGADDGCGGKCQGTCDADRTCQAGVCVCSEKACGSLCCVGAEICAANSKCCTPGNCNVWSSGAAMPLGRFGHAAAVGPDGKIYVVGGFTTVGGNGSSGGVTNRMDTYDPATDTWKATSGPNLPNPKGWIATATTGAGFYVLGGGVNDSTVSNSAYFFNFTDKTWSAVADFTVPRTSEAAVTNAVDGKVYMMGGAVANPDGGDATTSMEIYSPVSNTWSKGDDLSKPRYRLAAVALTNGIILAFGGATDNTISNAIETYSVARPQWGTFTTNLSVARSGLFAAALSDGSVYVGGGISSSGYTSRFERLSDDAKSWLTRASLPAALAYTAAVTGKDGRIYLFGGRNANGVLSNLYIYTP